MTVDILAIGAHPDDVEIGIGGLVRKLADQGYRVGILDLTQGELGTRGSVEERRAEAAHAAEILGVAVRENAGLPDGGVADSEDQRLAVIPHLRTLRPRMILAPMRHDQHPDHEAAHYLVRNANHFAGLAKMMPETAESRWRTPRVLYYSVYTEPAIPDLIVDVTGQFDAKLDALRAFRSQFHNPDYDGQETWVSTAAFWETIRTRAQYWGARLGVPGEIHQGPAYAECLFHDGPIPVQTLPGLEEPP